VIGYSAAVSVEFFQTVCDVLGPRCPGGRVEAARIGAPFGPLTLARWVEAGLLGTPAAKRLKQLVDMDAVAFEAIAAVLDHGPEFSSEGDWSWDDSGPRRRSQRSKRSQRSQRISTFPVGGVDPPQSDGWGEEDDGSDDTLHESGVFPKPVDRVGRGRFECEPAAHDAGRFVDIHLATDLLLGREVALHFRSGRCPLDIEAFIATVRTQGALQHPSIQPIYEMALAPSATGGDVPFFATSRPQSTTLDAVIKARARGDGGARTQWTLHALLEAVLDVARGIGFAHRIGFVHRDIRAWHVYMGHYGEVLLGGWFRARKITDPINSTLDAHLEVVNSGLGYLAPERLLRGLSAAEQAADVWGLGALLYAVLAERPPFSGPSSSDMLDAIRAGCLLPPGAQRSGIPVALEDLCMRALVIDPDDRRLTADEFTLEIEGYLEGNRTATRRSERGRALFAEAEAASDRFMEARTAIHAQRASGMALPSAGIREAARVRAERWFQIADEGYLRTESVRPGDPGVQHSQVKLYARALQDAQRGWLDLPEALLSAGLELFGAEALSIPGHVEVRTAVPGAKVWFHHFVDDEGVLSLDAGRPLGETPIAIADVTAGSYLLRVKPAEGPEVRVPVLIDPGEVVRLRLRLPEAALRGTVYIAAGPCRVGSPADADRSAGALPEGRADLPAFFLGREPVTVRDYQTFLDDVPDADRWAPRAYLGAPPFWVPDADGDYSVPFFDPDGAEWGGDCAIVGISPEAARAYAAWLTVRDGVYWRLPTELEWEKATRGADGRSYPWGERPEPGFCHHLDQLDDPPPFLGSALRDESVYGARDLVGTVAEICDAIDASGAVLRGGSWRQPFESCCAKRRVAVRPGSPLLDVGFRLAATPFDPDAALPFVEPIRDWPLPDPPMTSPSMVSEAGLLSVEMTVGGRTLFRGLPDTPPESPQLSTNPLENGPTRYRQIEEIARGSMGRVVLAHDRVLHRNVALKILHDKHRGDTLARYRFSMEARITGRLQHPLMLPVYDMGVLPDGSRFFAMRPVEGMSLRDVLGGAAQGDARILEDFPRDRMVDIVRRTCQGVAYAHTRNIVHRDLKPANILIGEYGEVVLVDLGLARQQRLEPSDLEDVPEARLLAGDDGRVTRIGSVIGTPYYMSPEQAMGLQDMIGPSSDVYGLGAILYHVLAGRPPFSGTKIHEVLAKVRRGNPKPPSAFKPDVPAALDRIVLDALSMDHLERPDSAMSLADGLRAFQEQTRLAEEHKGWAAERAASAMLACDAWRNAAQQHDQLLAQYGALREELRRADPFSRRRAIWRAEKQLSTQLTRIDGFAAKALRDGRMALTAGDGSVIARLVNLLDGRCRLARATDDVAGLRFYQRALASLDTRRAAGLNAGAPLVVRAGPGAARATVFHQDSADPLHAGPAPVRLPHVPAGSGYVRLTQGQIEVIAPFVVRRSDPVRLDVRLAEAPEGFVAVPASRFIFGERQRIGPLWAAKLPDFFISTHPVTCGEYKAFLDGLTADDSLLSLARRPRLWSGGPALWGAAGRAAFGEYRPDHPVTGVSLADAQAYARWRAEVEGVQIRLPASAEWEKAARGVDGRGWPWGDASDSARVGNEPGPLYTVDSHPGDVSLYGMRGIASGVFEWTLTWAPGGGCFVRGDCTVQPMGGAPCVRRLIRDPERPSPLVGFRLVIGPPPPQQLSRQ
jgi:serine/threonine protein kinase/formylglycine-generating enzyme required for sulfatase activity